MKTGQHSRLFICLARTIVVLVSLMGLMPGSISVATAQEAPAAFANQFFNAIGGETPEYMLTFDAVLYTPEGTYLGAAGPAQFGEALGASFSEVEFANLSVAQAGEEWVIASFTMAGIHTGNYRDITPNCAGFSIPGVALLRLTKLVEDVQAWTSHSADERGSVPQMVAATMIVEQWVNYDADLLASQIEEFNDTDSGSQPGCAD